MTSSPPAGPPRRRPPSSGHRAASSRRAPSGSTRPGRLTDLVERYGWRIYALPILAVVTIVAVLQPGHAHTAAQAAAPSTPLAGLATSTAPPATTPPATTAPPTTAPATTTPATTTPTTTTPATTTPTTTTPATEVKTESTACARNAKSTYVLIDISVQHAWMCDGARQVNSSAVTTGATSLGDATPTGSWIVQAKQPNRWLSGKDFNRFVHYWVPFDGNIGFHDAGWQTMPFGAAGYTKLGSHGCVHLPTPMMDWLYHWIKPGQTTVSVVA